jgi:tetratricopeptide (TPR) repeat protein
MAPATIATTLATLLLFPAAAAHAQAAAGTKSQQPVSAAAAQTAVDKDKSKKAVPAAAVLQVAPQPAQGAAAAPAGAAPAAQQAVSPAVQGAVPSVNNALVKGRELLRAGDINQATTVLQSARVQAASAGAKGEEASALFYIGAAQQARMQSKALPEHERQLARTAAIAAYQESLQANPASGPALNNLAQLYRAEPEKRADADALLTKAIALDDSHKGVYLLNRAALKRDAGDIPAALQLAEQAAADDRANLEAHQMVVDVALASPSAAPLLAYLKELNDAGLVARALDTAASALQQFPAQRAQLLTSIAASLGNAAYTAWPPGFADSDAGKSVQQFLGDETIGAGVRQLFDMLEGPVPAESLSWWERGFSTHQRVAADSAPAVMQKLMERCAEIYRSRGDPANLRRAESYYRMAIDLSGPGTDSSAFVALAELLFASGRVDELSQLIDRYEEPLLRNKGVAIAQADYRQIYELRLTLGMMYAYLGRWTNPQAPYKSAIWMLEHAQESAAEYNRGRPPTEQIGLPPDAVKMLAMGYAQSGDPNKSIAVRLDAAERYLKTDQHERAAEVLDADWRSALPAELDASLRQRLDAISARL